MSFLNATLALGMLAASVPVVLHFLAKQQPKRVVFPGVAFLTAKVSVQSSRLRIRRWWLLALRILAVAMIALALARPHIASTMAGMWLTLTLIGTTAVILLILATLAFSRQLSKNLAWGLVVAAVIAFLLASVGGVYAIANSATPDLRIERPIALAIVVDNSPASAWRVDGEQLNRGRGDEERVDGERPNGDVTTNSRDGSRSEAGGDTSRIGTRLAEAVRHATAIVGALPSGSRIAVIDRGLSPIGFSLDSAAAIQRLDAIESVAVPSPITTRIEAALELVRTSDLPDQHVVVISDMASATWDQNLPSSIASSPLTSEDREGISISILNVHESAEIAATDDSGASEGSSETIADGASRGIPSAVASLDINRWLSLPTLIDNHPPAGATIPLVIAIGTSSAIDKPVSATVQLRLYQADSALPVVRDGVTVYPPLRTVDRAAISIEPSTFPATSSAAGTAQEVVMSLPPLPTGTHHAVIELIGGDRFAWDDRRYLTLSLPRSPRVLLVGESRDETRVIAAAMTAPHDVDDPAAAYDIDIITYQDLPAVMWNSFDVAMLIDPPLIYQQSTNEVVGSASGLTAKTFEELQSFVARGGGVLFSLGPSAEVVSGSEDRVRVDDESLRNDAESPQSLLPPLVRVWRVPEPGTFLRIRDGSHPIFEPLTRPTTQPNWSDFRIRRYWQVRSGDPAAEASENPASREGSPWSVLSNYARPIGGEDSDESIHPSVLTRVLGAGRIAVTTTPLPALGPDTRSWNDLFGGADAWPAFLTVRSLAAWLADIDSQAATILVGQPAIIQPVVAQGKVETSSDKTETSNGKTGSTTQSSGETVLQWYPPDSAPSRSISMDDPVDERSRASVVIDDADSPGTYFLRGPGVWSGVSANLPEVWSKDQPTNSASLTRWFGENEWSITRQRDKLELSGSGSGARAVSLHGPLTLLVVLAFLGEQLLSNRFYGGNRAETSSSKRANNSGETSGQQTRAASSPSPSGSTRASGAI